MYYRAPLISFQPKENMIGHTNPSTPKTLVGALGSSCETQTLQLRYFLLKAIDVQRTILQASVPPLANMIRTLSLCLAYLTVTRSLDVKLKSRLLNCFPLQTLQRYLRFACLNSWSLAFGCDLASVTRVCQERRNSCGWGGARR